MIIHIIYTPDPGTPISFMVIYFRDLSFNGLEYFSHQGLSSVSSMNLDGNYTHVSQGDNPEPNFDQFKLFCFHRFDSDIV